MWALLLFKYIICPAIVIYNCWKLYYYFRAFNTWSETTGVVIGYKYSSVGNTTYVEVEFQSASNGKIKFQEDSNLPFITRDVYEKGSEVKVLYSTDKPDTALIKTTLSPIIYSFWIVAGVVVYFMLPYRF